MEFHDASLSPPHPSKMRARINDNSVYLIGGLNGLYLHSIVVSAKLLMGADK